MKILFTCIIICSIFCAFSQNIVVESNIRVSGTESIFYGFNEGTQVTFTMQTEDGKDIKEFEIIRYPDRPVYSDFKISSINKTFTIENKGIYEFRFRNGLRKRICNYKITSTDNPGFNNNIIWKTVTDTNFYMAQEKYVISADTSVQTIKNEPVSLQKHIPNTSTGKKIINFTLPQNTESWAFLIGTKNEVHLVSELADCRLQLHYADSIKKYPQMNALVWTAFGYPPLVDNLSGDNNIKYAVLKGSTDATAFISNTPYNSDLSGTGSLVLSKGKNQSSYLSASRQIQFALENINTQTSANLYFKVAAVIINKQYGTREVERFKTNTYSKPFHAE